MGLLGRGVGCSAEYWAPELGIFGNAITRPDGELLGRVLNNRKFGISGMDRLGRVIGYSAGQLCFVNLRLGITRPSEGPLGRAADCGIFGSQDYSAE